MGTSNNEPSSNYEYYFDRLILMVDGYIVYQDGAGESIDYFKGLKIEMPRFANPADSFMKVRRNKNFWKWWSN